jgi:hypothetical protein
MELPWTDWAIPWAGIGAVCAGIGSLLSGVAAYRMSKRNSNGQKPKDSNSNS